MKEIEERIGSRVGSLARRFDRVVRILEAWGYLDGWALTPAGERLARIFHESDLLLAEAIGAGLLDDLDPAALAGLVSCFTYEHRSPEAPPAPWFPSPKVRDRWRAIAQLATELNRIEDEAGLDLTRPPEPTFLAIAHAWAAGETLDEVLEDEDLAAGDFVRNVKQLIDVLGQVAEVADPETSAAARTAADRAVSGRRRGIRRGLRNRMTVRTRRALGAVGSLAARWPRGRLRCGGERGRRRLPSPRTRRSPSSAFSLGTCAEQSADLVTRSDSTPTTR